MKASVLWWGSSQKQIEFQVSDCRPIRQGLSVDWITTDAKITILALLYETIVPTIASAIKILNSAKCCWGRLQARQCRKGVLWWRLWQRWWDRNESCPRPIRRRHRAGRLHGGPGWSSCCTARCCLYLTSPSSLLKKSTRNVLIFVHFSGNLLMIGRRREVEWRLSPSAGCILGYWHHETETGFPQKIIISSFL